MLSLEMQLLPKATDFDVVIVVDILRMTTTSSVLLNQGLAQLYVVAEASKARALAKEKNALLLGERGGLPLPGFDGGNSPLAYLDLDVKEKRAVICTSNGSKAVEVAGSANHMLLGSIVNAAAVARAALCRVTTGITIMCAGTEGQVSLDDALGAAIIAEEMQKLETIALKGDEALMVTRAFSKLEPDLIASELKKARHGQHVIDLGFEGDITFAAKRNILDTVAVKKENYFVGVRSN